MKEEMQKWKEEVGLDYIERPYKDSLEAALKFSTRELEASNINEIYDILIVLSNYYLFLQTQIGLLYSRMGFIKDTLYRDCAEKIKVIKAGSFDEKKLLAVSADPNLIKQDEQCSLLKAKLDILRPLSDGVKVKIDSVQRILYRKKE